MSDQDFRQKLQVLAAILDDPTVEAQIMMVVEQFAAALAQVRALRGEAEDAHRLPPKGITCHWKIRLKTVIVHWRTTNGDDQRGIFSFAVELLWDDAKREETLRDMVRRAQEAQQARLAAYAEQEEREALLKYKALKARFAGRTDL